MNGVITIYKNNGAPLLRRRRQRAPLRGEDLADDRVEAVAVLHGGDGRPGDIGPVCPVPLTVRGSLSAMFGILAAISSHMEATGNQ